MAEVSQDGLLNIPIKALSTATITAISILLDPVKVIPTDEGLPRYWRGLAHVAGIQGDAIPLINSKKDPTNQVLNRWTVGTIGNLKTALMTLDRWDIVDDTSHMMEQDAIRYLAQNQVNSSVFDGDVNLVYDEQIITVGDVSRLGRGLEPQHYHAFLLYAEEDSDFASQIVHKMEIEYGLKLCIRDRDLVGGLAFEHEAIMRLIKERCNRLIVIVSPFFLQSEANKFFVTFAQALGIGQRKRKVVPCLYQRCVLPPELSYYFLLDYTRASKLWDFWAKLRDSIQAPVVRNHTLAIKEIEGNELSQQREEVPESLHDLDCASNMSHKPTIERTLHKSDIEADINNLKQQTLKPKSKNFLDRITGRRKQKAKKIAE